MGSALERVSVVAAPNPPAAVVDMEFIQGERPHLPEMRQ